MAFSEGDGNESHIILIRIPFNKLRNEGLRSIKQGVRLLRLSAKALA